MGKMFENASSLKPLGQLKPNCPGMIIGRSSTNFMFFYANIFVVSEKAAFEHFPIGSNVNLCIAVVAILDSDRHKKHKICIRTSKILCFFMPIGNPRWPPPQYID
jgi:hypothetical protein